MADGGRLSCGWHCRRLELESRRGVQTCTRFYKGIPGLRAASMVEAKKQSQLDSQGEGSEGVSRVSSGKGPPLETRLLSGGPQLELHRQSCSLKDSVAQDLVETAVLVIGECAEDRERSWIRELSVSRAANRVSAVVAVS